MAVMLKDTLQKHFEHLQRIHSQHKGIELKIDNQQIHYEKQVSRHVHIAIQSHKLFLFMIRLWSCNVNLMRRTI